MFCLFSVNLTHVTISFFSLICYFVQYLTESCSEEAARTAVRTLIDLGVSDILFVSVLF